MIAAGPDLAPSADKRATGFGDALDHEHRRRVSIQAEAGQRTAYRSIPE